jgi:hypothetical protein
VAAFAMTVDRKFKIDITDGSDRVKWVYAFAVDGEVVRIGWSERRLADRLKPWASDVTRGWGLTPEGRARRTDRKWLTWLRVIDCLDAIMRRYGRGTIYAKVGSEAEEHELLRRHSPRSNPGNT